MGINAFGQISQKALLQAPLFRISSWMHGHVGGFIQHQQVLILIGDGQVHPDGIKKPRRLRIPHIHRDLVSRPQHIGDIDPLSVDAYAVLPPLESGQKPVGDLQSGCKHSPHPFSRIVFSCQIAYRSHTTSSQTSNPFCIDCIISCFLPDASRFFFS